MKWVAPCFRGHDPKWSFDPISGEGAAISGGRFNRKGEPTLYLALDVMTAILECSQGFKHRLQPLTICEYDVNCDDIADLRDSGAQAFHKVVLSDLACAWLDFQRAGKDSPSWLVADQLKTQGLSGMLVPSFAPTATDANINLVLWKWSDSLPYMVKIYDPSGKLPKDQSSW